MAEHTASDLRARIGRRYGTRAQDDARGAAVAFEVPTGDMERRRADALVVNFADAAPPLVGFEIKLTTSDWARELADPAKAEAWARYCQLWWIVAPPGVVDPATLPPRWGLLEPEGKVPLRVVRDAQLRTAEPLPHYRMVQIVRQLDAARAAQTRAAIAEAAAALTQAKADLQNAREPLALQDIEDARIFRKLLDGAGLTGQRWQIARDGISSDAGKAMMEAVGGLARVQRTQARVRQDAQGLLQGLLRAAEILGAELENESGT